MNEIVIKTPELKSLPGPQATLQKLFEAVTLEAIVRGDSFGCFRKYFAAIEPSQR